MRTSVKITGLKEIEKFAIALSVGSREIPKNIDKLLAEISEHYAELVRGYIISNKVRPATKPESIAKRDVDALGGVTLVDTMDYVNSIRSRKMFEWGYRAGIDGKSPHRGGLNLGQIASYLEFGTSKMLPRPHWSRASVNFDKDYKVMFKAKIEKMLARYINKMGR